MSRRIHDLTVGSLGDLPASCRSCVFWEVANAPRGPLEGGGGPGEAAKEAWWQATKLEWGSPGKAVYVHDRPAGYATFGPAAHFPRARRMGRAVSEDALLLAALWVDPSYRGLGLSRMLLQSVLRETHRRGGRAIEAYGARTDAWEPCVVAESFLLASGFTVLHDDQAFPLLRLDLRQTVRWHETLEHALEGVLSTLTRRERAPARRRPALEARHTPEDWRPRNGRGQPATPT